MSQPEPSGPSAVRYPTPARCRQVAYHADRPTSTIPVTLAQQHIMQLFQALRQATELAPADRDGDWRLTCAGRAAPARSAVPVPA
jgi:hypothetical protein